jgi:succinate dehydrogenase / fumarate reductase membrane anchor subunit
MLTNVTSLTGNGLKDWLTQRVTAIYFAVYCFFILGFLFSHPHMSYAQWSNLFHHPLFKITSVIALSAFILHTWVGIWTVTTDYIKCIVIRLSIQLLVLFFLLAQLIWGLTMVWGQ